VWDVSTGKEDLNLKGLPTGPGSRVVFSPDGKHLATAANSGIPGGDVDCTVKVWDADSGQEVLSLKGKPTGGVMAFSPDGKRLATLSGSTPGIDIPAEMKLWDVASGEEILTLRGHTSFVTSVAFSPDGKRLASGSYDKTVKLWDAASGQEVLTLRWPGAVNNSLVSVAFSPDGKRLTSVHDSTIVIWDASKSMREVGQK
jgi:eukaryotic-like serine/threonine-protein kinase